jgi:hypothetical protein
MPSGPDDPRIACHSGLETVPLAFAALFGARLYDSYSWYAAVCGAGLPASTEALFVTVSAGARPLALFPMRRDVMKMASLTTQLTGLWRPLTAPGLTAAELHGVARAFGRWCRSWGTVRLDALDMQDPAWTVLLAGIGDAGMRPLPFGQSDNSTAFTGLGWNSYFAGRPAPLRAALERDGGQLIALGATLRVVSASADLAPAIDAYGKLRAANQPAAGSIAFDAALMHACAAEGWLRLGLLQQAGTTLAAQAWVVQGGGATLFPGARDAGREAAVPDRVLTGWMIRHLLAVDGVATLDFGPGDDEPWQSWSGLRRPRTGLILANPWRLAGLAALLRQRTAQTAPPRFQRRGTD